MTTPTLSAAPPPAQPGRRSGTMLWLVVGIFAAYLLTNGIMFYVASKSPPLLVSPNYYEESRYYDEEHNAEEASDSAGWLVNPVAATHDDLVIRLTDRAGRAASGFAGTASAYRPNDPALDQDLALREDSALPGQYHAHFGRPHAGQWQIHVKLRRGGEHLDHEFRIATP